MADSPRSLAIVPPPEHDELISSWLARVGRFYDSSVKGLFAENGVSLAAIDLAAIDIGVPRSVLRPAARLLGVSIDRLFEHSLTAAYPGAGFMVAREVALDGFLHDTLLRPAVCPDCLDQQRSERGFAWLRREWALAVRTICPQHVVPLIEAGHEIVHPAWQAYFRQHRRVQHATCFTTMQQVPVRQTTSPASVGRAEELQVRMLAIQDAWIARMTQRPTSAGDQEQEVAIVTVDILWAMTRLDDIWRDRPVYEAFALDNFFDDRHGTPRRRPGPADYTRLGVADLHAMLAAAVVVASETELYPQAYPPRARGRIGLAILLARLSAADADTLRARSGRWPGVALPASPSGQWSWRLIRHRSCRPF